MRIIYATDASEYRELPLAVAYPQGKSDVVKLIKFALKHNFSLIPRAAGTSLAGQCVGDGIVVDVSRYMTKIIEINVEEEFAIVEPGVIRSSLNDALRPFGYFFSPITSTANRATIGGMVGNNSSGTTSIRYGVTRDKVQSIEAILSDGSEANFMAIDRETFESKKDLNNVEGRLYQHIDQLLQDTKNLDFIDHNYPSSSIHRRNTGYALDELSQCDLFRTNNTEAFNFCKLLTGSEGTLAFSTSIKVTIDKLPPPIDKVIAIHFHSISDSLKATQTVMQFKPYACELMDKIILDCTKDNLEYKKDRWFINGDPQGVLMVECRGYSEEEVKRSCDEVIDALQKEKLGYAYPIIDTNQTQRIWKLRSAGLGLLSNISTDEKAVACIEDTAVELKDLDQYIEEFTAIMDRFDQRCVYYAHAGAGEIHLRPILNLRKSKDLQQFEDISWEVAKLVKKYNGSLSGEHGDGRVRANFIPFMLGEECYNMFEALKQTWDPYSIFNPGKITNAKPMTNDMRLIADHPVPEIETFMDFSETGGILKLAEKCNGSGDCRKLETEGGTMCPSFHATRSEKDTTRARANVLREVLTRSTNENPFDHPEIKEVMDLCISCKGCTAECPSNVDMSNLKAEFLYQWQEQNGYSFRNRFFSKVDFWNKLGQTMPSIANFLLRNPFTSKLIKTTLGIAPKRDLPLLSKKSLYNWYRKNYASIKPSTPIKSIVLFNDEFTNRLDTEIGIKVIELLTHLGYHVRMMDNAESGRAALSKGDLKHARKVANLNISKYHDYLHIDECIIGIEPSAILSFRDEYLRLAKGEYVAKAHRLAKKSFLIDEFIAQEIDLGNITPTSFSASPTHILLHGHCHQKALSDLKYTQKMLSFIDSCTVEVIPSGCCGMAGSFGYEAEHYEVSMKIGNLVLFPTISKTKTSTVIAANGTSCRHQIQDGTNRKSYHPIEILHSFLV